MYQLRLHLFSFFSVDSVMFVSHTLQAFIMNSDEGREARLCRRRERSRERRTAESSEERKVRLDKGSQASFNTGESVMHASETAEHD